MNPESDKQSINLAQSNIITSARYELSKLEKNLLYMAMRAMKPNDHPSKLYRISSVELQERTGEEIKATRLRDATKRMLARVIEAELPNGDVLQTHFFSSVRYLDGMGTLEIGIDPAIRPYYGFLKSRFTTFQLDAALALHSIYAKRMYELFSMYKNLENKTFRITLDKLKFQLGLIDKETGKDKHLLYGDFKRSVLDKAKEINTMTDLSFSYREIKLGRKVVELEFTILHAPKTDERSYTVAETTMLEHLVDGFRLRRDQAVAALQKHSIADLHGCLYRTQLRFKNGEIKNLGGYTAEQLGVN